MKLFQIFYDDDSYSLLQEGFIPLDNRNNQYLDWFEFSAIKTHLQTLIDADKDEYIGFFSPKFFHKTGHTAEDIFDFCKKTDADIISYSSKIEWGSLFLNSIDQGEYSHKGFKDIALKVYSSIGLAIDESKPMVEDHSEIIFSNFWLAKPKVWQIWLTYANKIFELEKINPELDQAINKTTTYRNKNDIYKIKIFIMERLINVIISDQKLNSVSGINFEKYFSAPINKNRFNNQQIINFLVMDSLKTSYIKSKKDNFLNIYFSIRNTFLDKNNEIKF